MNQWEHFGSSHHAGHWRLIQVSSVWVHYLQSEESKLVSLIDSYLLCCLLQECFYSFFITDVLKVHANSPFNMHCMRHSIKQSDRIGKSLKYCGQIMPCKFRLNLRSARSHAEHPSNALATRLSSSWENETFLLKYHNLMMSVSENVENKFFYSRFKFPVILTNTINPSTTFQNMYIFPQNVDASM